MYYYIYFMRNKNKRQTNIKSIICYIQYINENYTMQNIERAIENFS